MKNYLLAVITFLFNSILAPSVFCQKTINSTGKINSIINSINERNAHLNREFTLKFDTLHILFKDDSSQEQLLSTMNVEYDSKGRVKIARIINEDGADNYNYKYNYPGEERRFSIMEYFKVINGNETYDGFQIQLYNEQKILISTREYTKDTELVYADSLDISYNGNGKTSSWIYLSFQSGSWKNLGGVYDIVYEGNKLIGYTQGLTETVMGKDSLIYYLYTDVIFSKDDFSFLFREINEFFEKDSSSVDRFFLSREDASYYFINKPIQYLKYRIDGGNLPDPLVETAEYMDGPFLVSIITDSQGAELYRTGLRFDNKDRLIDYFTTIGNDTITLVNAFYNEHGRISLIRSKEGNDLYEERDLYYTDADGRLIEFRQEVSPDENEDFATILRFGYIGSLSNDIMDHSNILICPNPSADVIFFNKTFDNEQNVSFKIVDISGNIVRSEEIKLVNSGSYVDISNLKQGIYLITLIGEKMKLSTKFVKI